MLIESLILLVILFLVNKLTMEKLKKVEDSIERIVGIISVMITNAFLIIYYIDRLNLPTTLKLSDNIDTQNWLSIITTCVSSIISSTIGGLIALGISREQIYENNKQNNENLRIQNAPMLKYEIKTENSEEVNFDFKDVIITNCDDQKTKSFDLFIEIKNIGLNNIKRIFVDFESEFVKENQRIFGNDDYISVERGKSIRIYKLFAVESGKEYKIKLNIYYEDVLQNWYCQVVDINYKAIEIYGPTHIRGNIEYKVNEEKIIDKKEIKI